MSSTNLTRQEAQKRRAIIGAVDYGIAVDVTRGDATFPSVTTVRFEVAAPGSTFIDLIAQSVESVTLDGELVDVTYRPDFGIPLDDLTAGSHELVVTATCEYSRTGQGLHRFVDPVDHEVYLYTQFETADAKRVFACFDQPDVKATYTLAVTAPANWSVVTNSPQEVSPVEGDAGKAVFTSRIDYLLSTYLVALCAGPYYKVTDEWRGEVAAHPENLDEPREVVIPLGLYCRKSLADHLDADTLFTETKQGFDFYHQNFGAAYPFGKYDQLFVPEFNAGAMENAGAITYRDEYVFTSKHTRHSYERRCETVLHEMAHMWFGDLVTMTWWDDLWLNESFATWGSVVAQSEMTEYDTAWVTFANVEKAWAYDQDQLPSTHPVASDAHDIETVEQNFDGITYAKGASILKQLQAYVGRDAFFAGVRRHFASHAFGNATFDDLLGALAEASGKDLSWWADQWLKTTGMNELSADVEVDESGRYTRFAVAQGGATPGAGELRTHRIGVGLYSLVDGAVVRTHRVDMDIDSASTSVPEFVGLPKADLVLVNDDDLTYCMMKLDAESLAFVTENIDKITDPLARTLCWSAAWQATRSGEMRARDYIQLVVRGAAAESEMSVVSSVLRQAQTALRRYADPQWAASTGRQLLCGGLVAAARAAEPGSDHQLAFVQALSTMWLDDDATALLKAIVKGDSPLPGLVVDNQLRWDALTALAAMGLHDVEHQVSVLLEVDPSATGRACAARTRAAVPTSKAKRKVFNELTTNATTKLSNVAIRYKLAGFGFGCADEAMQQFNSEFFDAVLPVWELLPNDTATTIIRGLYPWWDISEAGLGRASEFLTEDAPEAVARTIRECQSQVERALRNRLVDAGE